MRWCGSYCGERAGGCQHHGSCSRSSRRAPSPRPTSTAIPFSLPPRRHTRTSLRKGCPPAQNDHNRRARGRRSTQQAAAVARVRAQAPRTDRIPLPAVKRTTDLSTALAGKQRSHYLIPVLSPWSRESESQPASPPPSSSRTPGSTIRPESTLTRSRPAQTPTIRPLPPSPVHPHAPRPSTGGRTVLVTASGLAPRTIPSS